MNWSIERVVALFTPVFSVAAGWVTSSVAQLVPGVSLNKGDVTALFITGSVVAASAALKWLHGRAKFVQFTGDVEHVVDEVVARVNLNPIAGPALSDIEAVVKSHADQIIQAFGNAVHAPASVDQVVEAVAQRLTGASTSVGSGGSATQTVPPPSQPIQ